MTVPATGVSQDISTMFTPQSTAPVAAPDALGKDAFLKLLVAQLRYQDPMNPAEGSEFVAQTAQFTSVEKLQELVAQTATSFGLQQKLGAGAMVGRDVTWTGPDGLARTGTVTSALLSGATPVLRVDDAGSSTDVPLAAVVELRAASR